MFAIGLILFLFGIACIVKAELILRDRRNTHTVVYLRAPSPVHPRLLKTTVVLPRN